MDTNLRDDSVVTMARTIAAFTRRLNRESADAAALCDEILGGPSAWWATRFRESRRARTTGVVRQLLDRMRSLVAQNPEHAEIVTRMAVEIAHAIDPDSYPAIHLRIVQGQALRDHAYVLSYRGLRTEALGFADRAEKLFADFPGAAYEAARLKLVKASILQSSEQIEDAVSLTREAAETFLRFGDRRRYLDAVIWQGIILYNAGAAGRAFEIWKPLEDDPALDDFGRAEMTHNIGLCLAAFGQHDAAIPYLERSAEQMEALGRPLEVTRARAVLGKSLLAAGQAPAAIPILQAAAADFASHGMVMDAGIIRLELAEALIVAGQPQNVAAVCRAAIADFTRAGAARYAATALQYLKEASTATTAPIAPKLVHDARAELRRLQRERPNLFAATAGRGCEQ